jgi:hypothetical protein
MSFKDKRISISSWGNSLFWLKHCTEIIVIAYVTWLVRCQVVTFGNVESILHISKRFFYQEIQISCAGISWQRNMWQCFKNILYSFTLGICCFNRALLKYIVIRERFRVRISRGPNKYARKSQYTSLVSSWNDLRFKLRIWKLDTSKELHFILTEIASKWIIFCKWIVLIWSGAFTATEYNKVSSGYQPRQVFKWGRNHSFGDQLHPLNKWRGGELEKTLLWIVLSFIIPLCIFTFYYCNSLLTNQTRGYCPCSIM